MNDDHLSVAGAGVAAIREAGSKAGHAFRLLVEEIDTLTARNDALTKKLAQAAELADMGRLTELRDFLTAMNQEAPDT